MATHCSTLAWSIPWTKEPGTGYRVTQSQTQLKRLSMHMPKGLKMGFWFERESERENFHPSFSSTYPLKPEVSRPPPGQSSPVASKFSNLSSVQLLSCVWLFATPWIAACQASLSITNSWSLPKLMSIELVMPSNYLISCCPLFVLPSIFPSNKIFSNESALRIRWPKHWSFSFNMSPSNEYSWSPLGWAGLISLHSKRLSTVFSNTTVQKHQLFSAQLSL